MAIQKLTRDDLTRNKPMGRRGANPEYVTFLQGLKTGEGGKAVVADEGVSRQSVKNRLNSAAKVVGVTLKFHRSAEEEVVFEVVDPSMMSTSRRGRPRKDAAGG